MRGVGILVLVAAASLGAVVACSSFSSATDTPDGGAAEAGSGDGAPLEASAPELDAGPDAVNLLTNGDFELGCAPFGGNNALLTPNTDPTLVHSGAGSCLVCTKAGADTKNELFATAVVPAPAGARFYGGAWLRSAPARAPLALSAHLDVTDSTGAGLQQGVATPAGPLVETWQKTTAIVDVTASDGGGINLYITGTEAGRCYLIDDAWLYQLK